MIKDKNDLEGFLKLIAGVKITDHHPMDPSYWSESPTKSVGSAITFDVQGPDCPIIVEDEVRDMWRRYYLGNDTHVWKVDMDDNLFEQYPMVYMWLKHNNVEEGKKVWIHWWW